MDQSKIAVRYAKAFFELGIEKNQLDAFRADMDIIAETCKNTDFKLLLESPVIKTSQKKKLFAAIFGKQIQEVTLKFLGLVLEQRREIHLEAIGRNFNDQYRNYKGIKAAKITTASTIDASLKTKISQVIATVFNTQVELTTAENPDLIGGFVLRVGDQQIDASVSTKLNTLKREFLNKSV